MFANDRTSPANGSSTSHSVHAADGTIVRRSSTMSLANTSTCTTSLPSRPASIPRWRMAFANVGHPPSARCVSTSERPHLCARRAKRPERSSLEAALDELVSTPGQSRSDRSCGCGTRRETDPNKTQSRFHRSKLQRECFARGAELIGWQRRSHTATFDARRPRAHRTRRRGRRLSRLKSLKRQPKVTLWDMSTVASRVRQRYT